MAGVVLLSLAGGTASAAKSPPSVLLISVDTLRADRLSAYGYGRKTSPFTDALLAKGARFTQARTVEPLTAPALASMLTSLDPHEHGSTRNGLRVRPNLPSLPRVLRHHGYRAAAFVGSWTLRDKLWGMAEHFDVFEDVLTRARWLGMVRREASAEDINERALDWLQESRDKEPGRPIFLWVHYVEPHAPYRLQRDYLPQLGAAPDNDIYSPSSRYDSEIAYVDAQIGRLLQAVEELLDPQRTLVLFVADHGESLGEHGYWGHGRHVYEPGLRIPLGIVWPARIDPMLVEAPALITDLPSTVLSLSGFEVPDYLQGVDWTPVLAESEPQPMGRVTFYQAHKGSIGVKEDPSRPRQRGLLEIARLEGGRKETLRVSNGRRRLFDTIEDPGEENSLVPLQSEASEPLQAWLATVREGLRRSDDLPPPSLSDEDVEALKALGYID
jgi:arylsulfatase A-like enzyme